MQTDGKFHRIVCAACGGAFEFPADGVGMVVPCPHCASLVALTRPISRKWLVRGGMLVIVVFASIAFLYTALTTRKTAAKTNGIVVAVSSDEVWTIETLCSFSKKDHSQPAAALTLGLDGSFYGTTYEIDGGWASLGTLYKVATNGSFATLLSFNRSNGAHPRSALTLGNDGNFYGTTSSGGNLGLNSRLGYGTVFRLNPTGTLTTLVAFDGNNGAYPYSKLVLGNDGNFYGTTFNFGALPLKFGKGSGMMGSGTVFKVATDGTLTTLAWFVGENGANPYAGLTLGRDGNFYGTTQQGGNHGKGVVFKITTNGEFSVLASFPARKEGATRCSLVQGKDGNFYGVTSSTLFRVATDGGLTMTKLDGELDEPSELALGNDGDFYGTTTHGGKRPFNSGAGYGIVFKVTAKGALTKLAEFDYNNGAWPRAGLTLGNDGMFYGTTTGGGSFENGTVFRFSVLAKAQRQMR